MSRDVSPDRLSPKKPDQSTQTLIEKIDKLAEEITCDIQSSPRSQLASKLDANVKNTQIVMATMKEKVHPTLSAIIAKQDKLETMIEGVHAVVCGIRDRLKELEESAAKSNE